MKPDKEQLGSLLYSFLDTIYTFQQIEKSMFEVNWQQIYLLQILRKTGNKTVGEISRSMQIPLFKASRLIKQMAADGYVLKARNADQYREIKVSITEAGIKLLNEVEDYHYQIISGNIDVLSEAEFENIVSGLGKLRQLLAINTEA